MRAPGTTDYSKLKRDGEKAPEEATDAKRRWWRLDNRDDMARSIVGTQQLLERAQSGRVRQYVINNRLYGNSMLSGAQAQAYTRLLASSRLANERMTFNAIQSIIDTLTSRVGETKPRPYYLTSGGSYSQQRRAKLLNQWTEGVFYETGTYDVGLDCFRDSAIGGDGLMHVFGRAGKLRHERTLSAELWVDENEAVYGFPRNMYRVKDVDRDELCADWSDDKKAVAAIEAAASVSEYDGQHGDSTSDMVRVIEAWHLAAENDNGDMVGGRHAFALANPRGSALLGEPDDWEFDFFPFARLPWCKRPTGFWSQGLCEQLQGQQLELNKELWFVQRSLQLAGTVKVFLRAGSKVVKEHLNNEVGAVVEYTGEPPVFFCPQPIHPVFFENCNRIIERMYRQAGASELSAAGKKPAGLDSGRALREQQDIESERFRTTSRLNDNFYLQVAALDAVFGQELKDYRVKVPGRNSFQLLDFKKDIGKLDRDEFVRQCFPVSRLPRDPAGRLQTIQEYIKAGFMTPRQGRRALDFPDLESVESLANAQEDMLTKVLDGMLDEGKYRAPEPTDDLALAKEMVLEYIQRYRQFDDAEGDKLDMLRRFNGQVDYLMKRAAGPGLTALPGGMAGAPAPGGAVPQGRPMSAPQSDLMPQAA